MGTCSLELDCSRPETRGGGCIQHKFAGGVRLNGVTLFRHDRDLGMTQHEKLREQFDGAKAEGKDIMRVPGSRPVHEVKTTEGWERK
jgi:hypothetical protein